jgi:ribosome-associated heat shock protein Hsp15
VDETRIDRWLWAVRLCRTRADATAACRGGHVRIDGRPAKPAATVRVGSRIEARLNGRDRVVVASEIIEKRVGAAVAAGCYTDHSAPPPRTAGPPPAARDRGAGRPTKRDRRRLDRLRDEGPMELPWIEIDDGHG